MAVAPGRNGRSKVDVTNLSQIARNRGSSNRILAQDKGPTLQVIMDRRYNITPAYINQHIGRFEPERITFEQMRLMRRHPTIAFCIHFLKAVLLNADWHIECSDPAVNAFVTEALRRIYSSLLRQAMTSLEFGFAPMVKRFETVDPSWVYTAPDGTTQKVWTPPVKGIEALVWKKPRLMLADYRTIPEFDGSEEFDGFTVNSMTRSKTDTKPLYIPKEYAFWYTNELDEGRGNLYGYPRTGYALQPWWSSQYRWLLEDRHFEQDADPPLMIRVPPGTSPHPETGAPTDNRVLGVLIGAALRDGATIVMDSEPYISEVDGRMTALPKWDAKFLTGGENLRAFADSDTRMTVAIMRALWIPEQALIGNASATSTATGARRAVEMYGQSFVASQSMVMADFDRAINDYMIPDLLAQNYVNPPECRKVTDGFNEDDLGLASDLLKIMVSQAPQYSQIDWRKIAMNSGLPLLTLEEQSARDTILGKLLPAGIQTPNGQTGETGDGNTANPQQKVRALLAAMYGDSLADEIVDLNRREREVLDRVYDLFARSTDETELVAT